MNVQRTKPPRWSILLPRLARYLPASLFERLRALPEDFDQVDKKSQRLIARELVAATRALAPLYRILIQYTPRYLLELNPTPGQPHGEILEGSFLFADVTGFTALTELLSRQGHARGREKMNQIMNRLFTCILDPLTASGGDLLIFAGDAVLAYFPRQDNDQDVLQATRAALRMERAISPFASLETEFGQYSLTIGVGVERGLAYAGMVGTKHRMELLVSGPAIHGATRAEGQAEPGEVILGLQAQAGTIVKDHFTLEGSRVIDDLAEALGDYEISLPTRKAGGSAIFGLDTAEVLKVLEANLQRVEQLAPFLPEDILARLVNTSHRRQLESEFRPVAVQFINVTGLEELALKQGVEIATEVFQYYFVQAQKIVNRHEGIITQIDAYAKGFTLLNTFGAPKAHEGTTLYAVSAALQLSQTLEQVNLKFNLDPPLQERSGITYGLVFTGEIGAKYRRESVVAGPAVNRAARLMSKARFGQVILDSGIWSDVKTAFVGEQLPALTLKGIEGPVVIVNVRQIRHGTHLQSLERPLVGRENEQARLAEALEVLLASPEQSGSVWTVSGETGIGKTSLMSDLATTARQRDLTVLAGRCQPHSKYIPLFPWVDLLTGWFGLDKISDPDEQRAHLSAELASLDMSTSENALADLLALPPVKSFKKTKAAPSMQEGTSMMALLSRKVQQEQPALTPQATGLAALLKHRLAAHEETGETDPEEVSVWQQLEERVSGPRVIIKLLTKLARRQPLVLILEDIHWLDDESSTLLDKLLPQVGKLGLMLVLTGHKPITGDAQVSSLPLGPLPDAALAKIAERALGARALDSTLAGWVCNQAGGNPLYTEELCRALRQAESVLLDRDTGIARWTGQIPTLPLSLHQLLLARLDELSLVQQDVLKRAAVLGVFFGYEALLKLCRKLMSEQEVKTILKEVARASFLTEVQDTTYYFNHPLMHETIYETLSFSQRQTWHASVGDWLADSDQEVFLDLIAYHYLRSANVKKAAEFGCRAGDRARDLGTYIGAMEYYEQVLELQGVPREARRKATESLADVLALQGDYGAAKATYRQAIELGSTEAQGKQSLLSGDVDRLAQTEFSPTLRPWADGAQAWLLARNGQPKAALNLVHSALPAADGTARTALEALAKTLTANQVPEAYQEWLRLFTNEVLVKAQ